MASTISWPLSGLIPSGTADLCSFGALKSCSITPLSAFTPSCLDASPFHWEISEARCAWRLKFMKIERRFGFTNRWELKYHHPSPTYFTFTRDLLGIYVCTEPLRICFHIQGWLLFTALVSLLASAWKGPVAKGLLTIVTNPERPLRYCCYPYYWLPNGWTALNHLSSLHFRSGHTKSSSRSLEFGHVSLRFPALEATSSCCAETRRNKSYSFQYSGLHQKIDHAAIHFLVHFFASLPSHTSFALLAGVPRPLHCKAFPQPNNWSSYSVSPQAKFWLLQPTVAPRLAKDGCNGHHSLSFRSEIFKIQEPLLRELSVWLEWTR